MKKALISLIVFVSFAAGSTFAIKEEVKNNSQNLISLARSNESVELEIAKVLLSAGADINAATRSNKTALMFAASKGDASFIELLLTYNPLLDTQDVYGMTALMYAVYYGHQDVVRLLLEKGADLEKQNRKGDTALDLSSLQEPIKQLLSKARKQNDIEISIDRSDDDSQGFHLINVEDDNESDHSQYQPSLLKRMLFMCATSPQSSHNCIIC